MRLLSICCAAGLLVLSLACTAQAGRLVEWDDVNTPDCGDWNNEPDSCKGGTNSYCDPDITVSTLTNVNYSSPTGMACRSGGFNGFSYTFVMTVPSGKIVTITNWSVRHYTDKIVNYWISNKVDSTWLSGGTLAFTSSGSDNYQTLNVDSPDTALVAGDHTFTMSYVGDQSWNDWGALIHWKIYGLVKDMKGTLLLFK